MSNQAFGDRARVRYPLRRHRQRLRTHRPAPYAVRYVRVQTGPKPVSGGTRMLIAFAGFLCGLTAEALVAFAEDHFHLAKDTDPDLFAIVLGTGFAGHVIYLIFGFLAVALLTAFSRRKWILWLLIGYRPGPGRLLWDDRFHRRPSQHLMHVRVSSGCELHPAGQGKRPEWQHRTRSRPAAPWNRSRP